MTTRPEHLPDDLAAVTNAEGHPAEAQRILNEEIRYRDDDGETYPDLPARSRDLLEQRHSQHPPIGPSIAHGKPLPPDRRMTGQ